jgi:hypothetical protein
MTPGQPPAQPVTHIAVNTSRAMGLYFNDTHVFFAEDTRVMRAPIDGNSAVAELVLDGLKPGWSIAGADVARVYVFEGGLSTISAAPLSGGR